MIITINKAIMHVIDNEQMAPWLSEKLMDIDDTTTGEYIKYLITNSFIPGALRPAEFKKASGFKMHLNNYCANKTDEQFTELSEQVADKFWDCISEADINRSLRAAIILVDFTTNNNNYLAIFKVDGANSIKHRKTLENHIAAVELLHDGDVLPPVNKKVSECAYINLESQDIRYCGKMYKIDGERIDVMSEAILECDYNLSPAESANVIIKAAKKSAEINGVDAAILKSTIGDYAKEHLGDDIVIDNLTDTAFSKYPNAKEDFAEIIKKTNIDVKLPINSFVSKKLTKDIKLVTDTGITITVPSQCYRDAQYFEKVVNDDGTMSISINGVKDIKST